MSNKCTQFFYKTPTPSQLGNRLKIDGSNSQQQKINKSSLKLYIKFKVHNRNVILKVKLQRFLN